MELLSPLKDKEKLWPGLELNLRPSCLITAAPLTEPHDSMYCIIALGDGLNKLIIIMIVIISNFPFVYKCGS